MKKIYEVIGENIRSKRRAMGLSQGDLGKMCGLSMMTVNKIESGRPVRGKTLTDIAKALGINELDLAIDPKIPRHPHDYSEAIDVLTRLQRMPKDVRALVLALVYEDPDLAEGVRIDLETLFAEMKGNVK